MVVFSVLEIIKTPVFSTKRWQLDEILDGYERYGHTDCERNGKGNSGSRNRGQMKCVSQN